MKRLWIGLGVLAVLLAMGLWVSAAMEWTHVVMVQQLQQASRAAMAEDWPAALEAAQQAQGHWNKHRRWIAAFADHTPMDEIEGSFAEMEVYAQDREKQHFAATCARLAQLAEAMGESHAVSWWNLL